MSKTTLPPEAALVGASPVSIPGSLLRGRPCLCAPTIEGASEFLVLDGSRCTVGRGEDRDLVVVGDSVSREQFTIWREGAEWALEDTSRHGTQVDTHSLTRGETVHLSSDATVYCGGVPVSFYTADSRHQPVIRSMLEDPVTGLLQRSVFMGELDRSIRQSRPGYIALFDIDGCRDLRKRIGPVKVAALSRDLAKLLERNGQVEFGRCVIGQLAEDEFAVLVDGGDRQGAAAAIERLRVALLSQSNSGATLSAALLAVDVTCSALDILSFLYEKLRQAKLAGGDRSAVSEVRTQWFSHGLADWMRALPTMNAVALIFPRDAEGWTAEKQASVRTSVARGLDHLPAGSRVVTAWTSGGQRWHVASNCSASAIKSALKELPEFMALACFEGPGAVTWVETMNRELAARAGAGELNHPFLKLFEHDASLDPSSQLHNAPSMFESALAAVTAIVVGVALWEHAHPSGRQPVSNDGFLGLARAIAELGRTRGGAGALLKLLEQAEGLVSLPILPEPLRACLSGKWEGQARSAIEKRNECTHNSVSDARRHEARQALWAATRGLCEALPASNFALVAVEQSERIRGKPEWSRLKARYLVGLAAPPREERDVHAELWPGLWAHTAGVWVPLSPLLDYRRCDHSKADLFVLRSVDFLRGEVRLGAITHACDQKLEIDPENHLEMMKLVDTLRAAPRSPLSEP